jgi:hypothetical protein
VAAESQIKSNTPFSKNKKESKSATTATTINNNFVHLTIENGELQTENAVNLEMLKLNKILTLFLL